MPRLKPTLLLTLLLAGLSQATAATRTAGPDERLDVAFRDDAPAAVAQQGGKSLSEAVEDVRRRGDVERIISAETRTSGGREVHHIKVLTKDGKVKTFTVPGRRLG